MIIFFSSCADKETGIEYWVKRINQNGDMTGFMVTQDYCSLLRRESKEWENLNILYDSLVRSMNLLRSKKEDSLSIELINLNRLSISTVSELDRFMHDMIADVGGYCSPDFISLPALPYRRIEMEKFWEKYSNQTTYLEILLDFNSDIYALSSQKSNKVIYRSADDDINKFKKMNNVEALLYVMEVEHKILKLSAIAQQVIIENQESEFAGVNL